MNCLIKLKYCCLILLLCCGLCPNVWAYKCSDTSCDDLRIGLGVYYGDMNASSNPKATSYGGYIPVSVGKHWRWFGIGADFLGGISHSQIEGSLIGANAPAKDIGNFVSAKPRVGINLGSLENPLFISVIVPLEVYDFRIQKGNHLQSAFVFIGGSISGRKSLNKAALEYGLSYSYAVGSNQGHTFKYQGTGDSGRLNIDGGSLWEGSLGIVFGKNMAQSYEKSPVYYTKLKVRYFDLNAGSSKNTTPAFTYPATKNLVAMLEFGVSLDFRY